MTLRKSTVRPDWDDPLLTTLRSLIDAAGGLFVFASTAAGGRVPASLINAGLIEHPGSGVPVLAHVAYGDSLRVARLAKAPGASLTVHDGRKWLTAEGGAELVFAPWDERSAEGGRGIDEDGYTELLRETYRRAGGGEHPDWPEYDAAMRRENRVVVLVGIDRLYGLHWD